MNNQEQQTSPRPDPEHGSIRVVVDRVHLLHLVENAGWSLEHAHKHEEGDPLEETPIYPTLVRLRGLAHGDVGLDQVGVEYLFKELWDAGITVETSFAARQEEVVEMAESYGFRAKPLPDLGRIHLWTASGDRYIGVALLDSHQLPPWRLYLPADPGSPGPE